MCVPFIHLQIQKRMNMQHQSTTPQHEEENGVAQFYLIQISGYKKD